MIVPCGLFACSTLKLMRILAIETIAIAGSLALLENDRVIAELALPEGQRSAQSLAPTIATLLASHCWSPATLQLIAVAQGPGSFTGLRVGVTTAKTLAYALGAQVLGVDTLEILAAQAKPAERIHPVLDAQRTQLFTATFTWNVGDPFPAQQSPTRIADLPPWLAALQTGDIVIGPAAAKLLPQLSDGVVVANAGDCQPHAATLGRLAWRDYSSGRRDDLWKLAPLYYRASAAEEKAASTATGTG